MKFDKRAVTLFVLTLAIVGGYLPYRLGYWSPNIVPVKAAAKPSVAITGTSNIDNISVVKQTDNDVTIGLDIDYNGEFGKHTTFQVELITSEHGYDYVYGERTLGTEIGKSRKTITIERPYAINDTIPINKIRVSLYGARRTLKELPELIETADVDLTWPSLISDADIRSKKYWETLALKLYFESSLESSHATLNRYFENWKDPQLRDIDGKWRLDALEGIGVVTSRSKDWPFFNRIIQEGKARYPKSEAFSLIEADYWLRYAWDARGHGYSKDVTDTGWQLFRERLDKAEQVLLESRDYASDNPIWHQKYLGVAMGKGWDNESILALFLDAIEQHPYNYQTYFNAANAVSPKWGGSTQLMDLVARAADKNVPEPERDVIYARVYWSISQAIRQDEDLFKDTLVSWPRMRSGFYQLLSDFPDSDWNLNNFGRFSCGAGDAKTYQDIRQKIGESRIVQSVWSGNTSLEACDRLLLTDA